MILISANLKTYKEARGFAMEQVGAIKDSGKASKKSHAANVVGNSSDADEPYDAWAGFVAGGDREHSEEW